MSNDQTKDRVPGFHLTRVGRVVLACILMAMAIWPMGMPPQATQAAPVYAPQTPTPPASPPSVPVLGQVDALTDTQAAYSVQNILSNGQFVYGPNIGNFDIADFFSHSAPHLLPYAEELYVRSEYHSMNPKVYLTLIEMTSQLISNQEATMDEIESPLGFEERGFITQIDRISEIMDDAYYLRLYQFPPLPETEQSSSNLTLTDGSTFEVPPTINAGTYAVMATLAQLRDADGMAIALDNADPDSFYQTYLTLFPDDNPLSESNPIYVPGGIGSLEALPLNLLQLPYLRGEAWQFNGVHGTNMSSLDFSPGWQDWGIDTSDMWVAAAAAGTPHKISDCYFKITHSDGWETLYYHLENIQNFGSSIQQNDRIGVIADTYAEATCNGGYSARPHVHFTLQRNGVWIPLNGTALSGWVVHSGRWDYDTDPNYMWLERNGVKKYAYEWLLNDVVSVNQAVFLPIIFRDVP